jgi:bacillithiol biosynthesis deacetylase BshB1
LIVRCSLTPNVYPLKLDILVLASHPDDAELGCGGTIVKHIALGRKVGVVDFTRGELGTRGTPELRQQEAAASAKILGLAVRENLGLPDGFFRNEREHQLEVARAIRRYKPEIVLANAVFDRHPDHGRGADLAFEACFVAGLAKVITEDKGERQAPWRPHAVYHYIQSLYLKPDFIVDVSAQWETKMAAVMAYKSQFHDPSSREPETYISKAGFLKMLHARATEYGHAIGAEYGEGFTVRRTVGVNSLFDLR